MNPIFAKIGNFLKGSFLKDTADIIDKFVQTKEEKAEAHMLLKELSHKQELELARLEFEAEKELNRRIKDLEGTAKDLNQAGFIGKIVLFFRGAQRPVWGFAVMYMDFMVFSGKWSEALQDEQIKSAFWVINLLVLGFLFGERAVKNLAPIITQTIKNKMG